MQKEGVLEGVLGSGAVPDDGGASPLSIGALELLSPEEIFWDLASVAFPPEMQAGESSETVALAETLVTFDTVSHSAALLLSRNSAFDLPPPSCHW